MRPSELLISAVLLIGYLLFPVTYGQSRSSATSDTILELLNKPAPAPSSTTGLRYGKKDHPEDFYSEKHVPSDDAPIVDLIDYWNRVFSVYSDHPRGTFAPLLQSGDRTLQSSDKPGLVWAAIPDRGRNQTEIGRFDQKIFRFR